MLDEYKLGSICYAIFDDGKVLPFIYNKNMSKIKIFGKRIDVEVDLENVASADAVAYTYEKLSDLRKINCKKIINNSIGSESVVTKLQILDIASSYENVLKRGIKVNLSDSDIKFIDQVSKDF